MPYGCPDSSFHSFSTQSFLAREKKLFRDSPWIRLSWDWACNYLDPRDDDDIRKDLTLLNHKGTTKVFSWTKMQWLSFEYQQNPDYVRNWNIFKILLGLDFLFWNWACNYLNPRDDNNTKKELTLLYHRKYIQCSFTDRNMNYSTHFG